jgi:hypothetical protein
MGLTTAYLINASKLEQFLNDLRSAQAPERFTLKFLEELGYKSTNDRLFIGLLKAVGMIDDSGVPTQRYFAFLDDTQWREVLAEGVRDAYEDLFRLNKKAHNMSRIDVTGKLKSLTEGKKSENVIDNMARTFLELAKLGDFSAPDAPAIIESTDVRPAETSPVDRQPDRPIVRGEGRLVDGLSYRIELVLPPTRDKAIYDALFRSLREHLL